MYSQNIHHKSSGDHGSYTSGVDRYSVKRFSQSGDWDLGDFWMCHGQVCTNELAWHCQCLSHIFAKDQLALLPILWMARPPMLPPIDVRMTSLNSRICLKTWWLKWSRHLHWKNLRLRPSQNPSLWPFGKYSHIINSWSLLKDAKAPTSSTSSKPIPHSI